MLYSGLSYRKKVSKAGHRIATGAALLLSRRTGARCERRPPLVSPIVALSLDLVPFGRCAHPTLRIGRFQAQLLHDPLHLSAA